MTRQTAVRIALAAVAIAGVSACGTSRDTAETAACTKEALAGPAADAARALGPDNVYRVEHLDCADDWAVTGGLLADKSNPAMGAPTSFVFQQQGARWIAQKKATVCGTDPVTTTPPSDAKIPAALFVAGCAAG